MEQGALKSAYKFPQIIGSPLTHIYTGCDFKESRKKQQLERKSRAEISAAAKFWGDRIWHLNYSKLEFINISSFPLKLKKGQKNHKS